MEMYELKLRDYAEMVYKQKWLALIIFCASLLVCLIFTNVVPPKYKTSLIFKVENLYKFAPSELLYPDQPVQMPPSEELFDYAKRITSTPVIEAMLKETGILKVGSPLEERELKTEKMAKLMSTKILSRSNMIQLTVVYKDPVMAAAIASKTFEIFKKVNLEEKNGYKRNTASFIKDALDSLSDKLKIEEIRMRELAAGGAVGTVDVLHSQIDKLSKKRIDLLSYFTEDHPDVIALSDQIDELKDAVKKLPKEEFEYSALNRDVLVDRKMSDQLKQKYQEAQLKEAEVVDNIVLIENAPIPRRPFLPNKPLNYLLGIILGAGLAVGTVIFIEQVMETSIGRIEDIEELIKVKVAGIIPFSSRRSANDAPKSRFMSIFSRKPPESAADYKNQLVAIQNVDMAFEESFHMLGTNIQTMFGENGRIKNKAIMISSSLQEEGKTVISSNLAVVFAQMGYKTLLVDSDIRKPSVHKIFGFKEKDKGFGNLLAGDSSLEELESTVVKTATDLMLSSAGADSVLDKPWLNNLHILTAGSSPTSIIHLCNPERIKEVFSYLKKKYDIVIIDSSPILFISDPSLIIPSADGIFLVYRIGATSRLALRRSKANIESIKAKGAVNGLILNNTVPDMMRNSHYSYYQRHYASRAKGAS